MSQIYREDKKECEYIIIFEETLGLWALERCDFNTGNKDGRLTYSVYKNIEYRTGHTGWKLRKTWWQAA